MTLNIRVVEKKKKKGKESSSKCVNSGISPISF